MKKATLSLIRFYQRFFSKALVGLFGGGCRFSPSCSDYSYQAVKKFGVAKGTVLSLRRLSHCHPLSQGGTDPLPIK